MDPSGEHRQASARSLARIDNAAWRSGGPHKSHGFGNDPFILLREHWFRGVFLEAMAGEEDFRALTLKLRGSWTPEHCAFKESTMAKTRPPYTPEFRRQMVELVYAGRSPED